MRALLRGLFQKEGKSKVDAAYLLSLFISVFLALLLGALIMLLIGKDPLAGYAALIKGALGSPRAIGNTLARSATLFLTGLAVAIAAQPAK